MRRSGIWSVGGLLGFLFAGPPGWVGGVQLGHCEGSGEFGLVGFPSGMMLLSSIYR